MMLRINPLLPYAAVTEGDSQNWSRLGDDTLKV
jgi:hypothetical protein